MGLRARTTAARSYTHMAAWLVHRCSSVIVAGGKGVGVRAQGLVCAGKRGLCTLVGQPVPVLLGWFNEWVTGRAGSGRCACVWVGGAREWRARGLVLRVAKGGCVMDAAR